MSVSFGPQAEFERLDFALSDDDDDNDPPPELENQGKARQRGGGVFGALLSRSIRASSSSKLADTERQKTIGRRMHHIFWKMKDSFCFLAALHYDFGP